MLETKVVDYQHYINGKPASSSGDDRLPVLDPATGQQWATVADGSAEDVRAAVDAAVSASAVWGATSPATRGRLLLRLADVIEARGDELAALEVRDNGKLLREMSAQLRAIPNWYRYYAGLADKIQGATVPMERASLFNFTVREPFGVVACITPWNSPLLLGSFTFAPAIAAGNVIVLKPSEHASVSSLEFARCFADAGFPPGVFNVVTGRGAIAGDALVTDSRVERVVFTGSGTAGSIVASQAAGHFAEVTLELGGKSPNIVFADADLDAAVPGVLSGIFAASGQTCIAGSRTLVQRRIYDELLERLVARTQQIRIGNPMLAETEMGPLANEPQFRKVQSYVDVARADGARLVTGGGRPERADLAPAGLFFEPTIFADVRNEMRIAREEVFGPLLSLIPFDSDDEAIAIANDTEFGLAAGVWTNDLARAHRTVRALRAGTVWVNTYRALAPAMPFGGFKGSGIGSENGSEAINDFTRVKAVWIETQPSAGDPFLVKL
ncbi:MAG: aldehyde dehydrogenase [Candidatus Velthaea sp.]|jgi:aldehyde dehydrogenase (NAD+)